MAYREPKLIFQAEDYFVSYVSTPQGNVTGNGVIYPIICDGVIENFLGNYDSTTGVYTASLDGFYSFTASVGLDNGASGFPGGPCSLFFDGSVFSYCGKQEQYSANANVIIFSKEILIPMSAGDTMSISTMVNGAGVNNFTVWGQQPQPGIGNISLATVFSGYKIY